MNIEINDNAPMAVLPVFASAPPIPQATASIGVASFGAAAALAPIAEIPTEIFEISFDESWIPLESWNPQSSIEIVLSEVDWNFVSASLETEPAVSIPIQKLLKDPGILDR